MRRRLVFSVLLLAGLGLAVTTSAGKTPTVKEIPVTVIIADSGYAIQSDNHTPYVHGQEGVRAVLVSLGNLALDTSYQTSTPVRKLSLDFTGCASSSCSPPWDTGTGAVVAFLSTSSCTEGRLLDMPVGGDQLCNLNVNFGAAGLGWFIRFGEPDGTTPATVTRVSLTSWTIEVPAGGVAKLLSYPTKGRIVLSDKGDFVMPVHLTVTQP